MSPTPVPGLVVVRGAGDLATGAIQKLAHAGFSVLALETELPLAIRWHVALATAVTRGSWAVEDVDAVRVDSWDAARAVLASPRQPGRYAVPVLVDPDASLLDALRPWAVVDAILAKRNLGTSRAMAPVTVGLGPGFTAGDDVDFVVETMRGHDLGRVLDRGPALPNTGVPGLIAGRAAERVLHAPLAGTVTVLRGIGDVVEAGELVCRIGDTAEGEVRPSIGGLIRGMLPNGHPAAAGMKIADVDPRTELAAAVDTISDKARTIGGGVLDAVTRGLSCAGLWAPPKMAP